jgi:hypothetical protein
MMNRVLSITIIASLALLVTSCKSKTAVKTDQDRTLPMFEMSTGPCFGKCPIYHLSIDANGLATLDRKRFFKEVGVYQTQLDNQMMIKVISTIDQVDFLSLPEKLESEIPDLPATTFVHHKDGKAKSVWAKENMPEALRILKNDLELIIRDGDWTVVQLHEQKAEDIDDMEIVYNELIIKMNQGIPLNRWQKKYSDYGLRLLTRLDKDLNVWLYGYNKDSIEPAAMIELLKEDAAVDNVEFNYRLSSNK